ncbi:MAG: hypothetical protein LUE10_09170 [Alistipes sp.]|nr:hypothetical protein [Alistipes sp.]
MAAAIYDAFSPAYPRTVFTGRAGGNPPGLSVSVDVHCYGATIYGGMWWHAQTKYVVTVKNGDSTHTQEAEQLNGYFNVWGKPTAKRALDKCFYNANLKLFGVIYTLL